MQNFDVHDAYRRHLAGESVLALSQSLGVSRPAIMRRFAGAGLKTRDRSQAAFARLARMTPESRLALAKPAHAAVRGVPKSEEHLCKIAVARQMNPIQAGPSERTLGEWLRALGAEVVPQKAVGRYNVDLALAESRIAVEIFGGNWHASGRHAARFRPRIEYLFDRGWHTVAVWITASHRLAYPVAENIIALHEVASSGEPLGRQEHVIRGDGYVATPAQSKPHNGAIVLGFNPGNPDRGDDGRFR